MNNCLVVYYSRSNKTKNIAFKIQKELKCDICEVESNTSYSGVIGYIKGIIDAKNNKQVSIKPILKNIKSYDTIIVGTPVWASNMANPILSFLKEYKNEFNNVALFCTCGSGGFDATFNKMEEIIGKKATNTVYFTSNELNDNSKLKNFINSI